MHRWKIFVVTSPAKNGENLRIPRQLAEADLPFELVEGMSPGDLPPERLALGKDPWDMSREQLATYHTHMEIAETIAGADLDHGVVIESDAFLRSPTRLTLGNIWIHLPKDADHVQLHDLRNHLYGDYRMMERSEHFNKLACTNVLMIGYIISPRLAKYLVKQHRLPRRPFDHQLIEISKARIFDFYDINERLLDGSWIKAGTR
jgi:GR25 family glycosyltransferase involved in LPS biosynthesis